MSNQEPKIRLIDLNELETMMYQEFRLINNHGIRSIMNKFSDTSKTKDLLSQVYEEGCIHTEDNTTAFIKGGSVCPKFEIDKECITKAKGEYINNLIQ